MHVTYFDEVKANPGNGQHHYFVGGLSIPIDRIRAVEEKINNLADEIFGTTELRADTEFHAAYIYFRKGPFKGFEAEQRIALLGRLARIIAEEEEIRRVYSAIDVSKLKAPERAAEFAFAYFCERVEMLNRTTLLIGDLDDEQAKSMIADFARFRARGTPWDHGIKVEKLVDAVHFARSHHSRMIQLADTYLFAATHRTSGRKGWMAEALTKELSGLDLWPNRYKLWPKS